MRENNNTVYEPQAMAESASTYLSKYFDVNCGRKLNVVFHVMDRHLPNDKFEKSSLESPSFYKAEIDGKKVTRKLRKENLEDRFQFVFDIMIGEEIGKFLFYVRHEEMHKDVLPDHLRGLIFVQDVIGYYSGMVYANRESSSSLFLKPDFLKPNVKRESSEAEKRRAEERDRAYSFAERLYQRYGDTKLEGLNKVKSLSEFNSLIQRLEV